MSEVSNAEVAISPEEQEHNEAVEANANQGSPDGLPSDNQEEGIKPDMFYGMSDEWKDANLTDGKLFGKFDSMEAMAKSYQKINDERASNGQTAKEEATKVETETQKATVANAQLGEIANNGFDISEENYQAFEEAGMSRMEAENMAYRMEKAANQAYGFVGGKDNYNNLMSWAENNLNDTQIKAFAGETIGDNFTIKSSGEFAIKGLQAMMAEANKSGTTQSARVSGNTASNVSQGWASRKEYDEDMKYLRNNPRDTNAQRAYDMKSKQTNYANLR